MRPSSRSWLLALVAFALLAGCIVGDPEGSEATEATEASEALDQADTADLLMPDEAPGQPNVQAASGEASRDLGVNAYPRCNTIDGRTCVPGSAPIICLLAPGEPAVCDCNSVCIWECE